MKTAPNVVLNLRGQTREASLCPSKFYAPDCKNCNNKSNGLPCSSNECKPKMMHQPSCQMQYYPRTPLPQPSKVSGCKYQENNRQPNINNKQPNINNRQPTLMMNNNWPSYTQK